MAFIVAAFILYIAMMAFLTVSLAMAAKAGTHVADQQEDEEQQRFIEAWMKKKNGPK